MKQKMVDKVILFYKVWSAALMAIFIFMADYRTDAFNTWWISTAVLMMYLLINILYLANLKRKITEDRLKEVIEERNARLSRRANRLGKHKEDES